MQQPLTTTNLFPQGVPMEPMENAFAHNLAANQQVLMQQDSVQQPLAIQQAPVPQSMAMPQVPFAQPQPTEQQFQPIPQFTGNIPEVTTEFLSSSASSARYGVDQNDSAPQQQSVHVNKKIAPDATFRLDPDLWQLAVVLSSSLFVPLAIRSTSTVNHTGDVYILLLKARALGLSVTQAFTDLYVLSFKGNSQIGLYVKTKAAICTPYGQWDVAMLPDNSGARASGWRYDTKQHKDATFTVQDAMDRGMVYMNQQGQLSGQWADKLPDMMRTRALGRLLDALFPDVISGIVSMDDIDDENSVKSNKLDNASNADYESGLNGTANDNTQDGDFDLKAAVTATRRNKRSNSRSKVAKEVPVDPVPEAVPTEAHVTPETQIQAQPPEAPIGFSEYLVPDPTQAVQQTSAPANSFYQQGFSDQPNQQ